MATVITGPRTVRNNMAFCLCGRALPCCESTPNGRAEGLSAGASPLSLKHVMSAVNGASRRGEPGEHLGGRQNGGEIICNRDQWPARFVSQGVRCYGDI
jgi:hypothetical protein